MDQKPSQIALLSTHQVGLLDQKELDKEIAKVLAYIQAMNDFIEKNYQTGLHTVPTDQALEFIEKERSELEAEVVKAEKYLAVLKTRRS